MSRWLGCNHLGVLDQGTRDAERERCAKHCEKQGHDVTADEIRALGPKNK